MSAFSTLIDNEERKLNSEQRSVVFADKNCVVSAGAGSGKTTVLSYRFLRLVMDNEISADRILTLTFTRKAALEMKERITNRLLLNRDSIKGELIKNLSNAHISTIDSFWSEIVRCDSISYGIARDFTLLSNDEETELVKSIALKFLETKDNLEYVSALSKLYTPQNIFEDFFDKINKNISFLSNCNAEFLGRILNDHVLAKVDELYHHIDMVLNSFEGRIVGKKGEAYKDFILSWNSGNYPEKLTFYNANAKKDYLDGVSEEIKELKNVYQTFLDYKKVQNSLDDNFIYFKAIECFASSLIKEKRRKSALTFADVSDIALDILEKNQKIRSYYKNSFDKIMIDEFQDNNEKQKKLLYLLSEKKDRFITPCPTINDIEEDKLFFVGDDKQSIYRFRGADVSVFRSLKDEIKNSGGLNLALSTNYRSDKVLINHFNSAFKNVFASAQASYEAIFEETQYSKDSNEASVNLALFDRDNVIEGGLDSNECEAEYIAEAILDILTSDNYLINGKRPKPSDIAILMRSASNQWQIEKALKLRGIDYQLLESRSLMIEAISSDFYSYLQYLTYPEDKIAFASLLKSPFVRLSENGFIEIMNNKELTLAEDIKRYNQFTNLYNEIKAKLYSYTLTSLLLKIYIDSGYKAYIDLDRAYSSYSEHFEYLFSYAELYDSEGYSLSDYIRLLRSNIGETKKLREATVLREKKEGVQIMTIHKSKGLEFPIVFCSFLGSRGKNDTSDPLYTYNGNLVFDSTKITKKILNKLDKEREDAEVKRLLYVAMTRAENYLFLTGSYKLKSDGSFSLETGKLLLTYLNSINFVPEKGSYYKIPALETVNVTAKLENHTDRKENLTYDGARDLLATFKSEETPSFDLSSKRVKVTESESYSLEGDRVFFDEEKSDEIIKKYSCFDKFGTLCHLALEVAMKGDDLTLIECDISEENRENEEILKTVRKFVDTCFNSELYNTYVKGNRCEEEVRFYSYQEGVVIEGVIDLIVFLEDKNIIIDYKSDRSKNLNDHKDQVVNYVKIASEIYNKPCYGTLFYLRDGKTEEFWDKDGNTVEIK